MQIDRNLQMKKENDWSKVIKPMSVMKMYRFQKKKLIFDLSS